MAGVTYRWLPSGTDAWSQFGNWSPAGVPGSGDRAIFDTGAGTAQVDGSQVTGILDLYAGGVTVNSGDLTVEQYAIIDSATLQVGAHTALSIGALEPAGTIDFIIGDAAGSNGVLSVSGPGSSVTSATQITAGYDGLGAIVVNGGSLAMNDGRYALLLGYHAGSGGSLDLTNGAQATGVGKVYVGTTGYGAVRIEKGSVLATAVAGTDVVAAYVGKNADTSSNVVVTDPGSQWVLAGGFEMFGNSTLQVLNGGALYQAGPPQGGLYTFSVGGAAASTADIGTVVVAGVSVTPASPSHPAYGQTYRSVINAGTGTVGVGYNATGVIFVQQGGQLFGTASSGYNAMTMGELASGSGYLIVSDAGSKVGLTGQLLAGRAGHGSVTVQNGATMATGNLDGNAGIVLGSDVGSGGTLVVTGAGSALYNAGRLHVGEDGNGLLEVLAGGVVTSTRDPNLGGALSVGDGVGTGIAVISGVGSRFNANGNVFVGDYGVGTLFIGAGGTLAATGDLNAGDTAAAVGVLTVDGTGSGLFGQGALYLGYAADPSGSWYLQASNGGHAGVAGSAFLGGHAYLSVDATSAIDIGGTTDFVAGVIAVEAGASLNGQGTITGSLANAGFVEVSTGGTLVIDGAASGGTYAAAAGSTLVFQGATTGLTRLAFDSVGGTTGTVDLGTGASTVASTAGPGTIVTRAGQSALVFSAAGNTVIAQGKDTIVAGSGAETIGVSGTGAVVFGGDAQLSFGSLAGSIVVGQARSLVVGDASYAQVFGSTVGGNLLNSGAGPATLVGGGNGDLLTASGAADNVLVAGGGAETLNASGSTGGVVTMFAGSGPDSLLGGGGESIMLAGTGQATMAGGAGTGVFAFISGAAGGADTITGFDASRDLVVLFGYSASEGSTALSHATVQGGSLVMTLSDGTHITFAGVTSLPGSSLIG